MKNAYSYVRFSTKRQAKGHSYQRQTEAFQKSEQWAESNGFRFSDDLRLEDLGVSGRKAFKDPKAAFFKFLEAVREGKIPKGSVFVVENLDRMSRAQISDALTIFMEILKAGIDIKTFEPDRYYTETDINNNPYSLMEPISSMVRAWEESERKSVMQKSLWEHRRKVGGYIGGRIPAWLKPRADKRGFDLIPERVEVVRQIFKLAIQGIGATTITKILNMEKVPPFGSSQGWTASYIHKMLNNTAIIGYHHHCVMQDDQRVQVGEPVADYYPVALEDPQDFYRAQSRKSKSRARGRNPRISNLFTGLLYNGVDGSPMYVFGKGRKQADGSYPRILYSQSSMIGTTEGPRIGVNLDYMERFFLEYTRELKPSDIDNQVNDESKELLYVSGRLATVNAKIDTLKAHITATDTTDLAPFLEVLGNLNTERQALSAKLEELQHNTANPTVEVLGGMQRLSELLEVATEQEREILRERIKGRIRGLVERIYLWAFTEPEAKRKTVLAAVGFKTGNVRIFAFSHRTVRGNLDLRRENLESLMLTMNDDLKERYGFTDMFKQYG